MSQQHESLCRCPECGLACINPQTYRSSWLDSLAAGAQDQELSAADGADGVLDVLAKIGRALDRAGQLIDAQGTQRLNPDILGATREQQMAARPSDE